MTPGLLTGVALAGAIGALARDALDRWLTARTPEAPLPVGILVVNVLGSFLLGLLVGAGEGMDERWLAVVGSGFAGAFTTFSTFAVQVWQLPGVDACRYVGTTMAGCVVAVAIGMALF